MVTTVGMETEVVDLPIDLIKPDDAPSMPTPSPFGS